MQVPSTYFAHEELDYHLHLLSSAPLNFHGDVSQHHVFTEHETHLVKCTMRLKKEFKSIRQGSAERIDFVKQFKDDIAALSPLVPDQVIYLLRVSEY